jgi:two-component system phosphate regulon response regulator OmpR
MATQSQFRRVIDAPEAKGCERVHGVMKVHILLVDDDPTVRALTELGLKGAGYAVTLASNVPEALKLTNEMPFDLAIVDLVMPGADGLELTKALKESHPDLPVLVLTGVGFDDDVMKEALKMGVDGYLSKGLTMSHLTTEIRRILSQRKDGSASPSPN